jgi:maleate isomerase
MLAPAAPSGEIVPLHLPSEPVGARGRLGLVGLATDLNSESDLRRMAPAGVEIFTNRVRNANPVTMDNHRAMAGDVTRAAADILPGLHLDAMIYGCTSGTVAIGEGEITRLLQAARPCTPCTNPITAVLAALRALGAQRIAVLTPYTRAVNDEFAAFLVGRGIAITRLAGFDLDSDEAMTAVAPAAILEAGLALCDQSADLLFVSCTALRTSVVVEALEEGLGKPVVASNPALLWHALRLIGNTDPISGFGRLFDHPQPDG